MTIVAPRPRSAKIIATLGPSSSSPANIRLLAEAGADIFRLNFSHGDHEGHGRAYETIRKTEAILGRPLAILADMQGPKIRVGKFDGGGLKLSMGGVYALIVGEETDESDTIPIPRPEILDVLEVGDIILADDGLISFEVCEVGDRPKVKSHLPGTLKDRKGFTVQGKALPVPALSEKDKRDLAYALDLGVDLIALSFVQTVEDVNESRRLIGDRALIVSKLEKPAALDNLEAIIDASDAIMIARGDLGVEFPSEQVPIIQRRMVRACRLAGRPVIVATQMLESMIENATPTRAESSDVATAIYQGVDGVMLSAETAVGRHPATAVAIMNRIIQAVEGADDYRRALDQYSAGCPLRDDVDITANAALAIATQNDAPLALRTGAFDRLAKFSRIRGAPDILYGSAEPARLRQAQLLWGVHPAALDAPGEATWVAEIMEKAGRSGRAAFAAWQGGEGLWAWIIGVENEHFTPV